MVREVGAGTFAGGAGTVNATGAETIVRMDLGTGTIAGVGTVRKAGGKATATGIAVAGTMSGVAAEAVRVEVVAEGAADLGTDRGIEVKTSSAAGIETGVALTLASGTGITGFSTNLRCAMANISACCRLINRMRAMRKR